MAELTTETLELLLAAPPADPALRTYRGTVTQAFPLRVQLDGDSAPLLATPDTVVAPLFTGDRVLCLLIGRALVVAGRFSPADVVSSTNYGTVSGSDPITGGGYEKKANGRLTCWIQFRITPVANANTSRTWTFPVPFVGIPGVNATPSTSATTVQGAYTSNETSTTTEIAIVRSNTTNTTVNAVAEGFWR